MKAIYSFLFIFVLSINSFSQSDNEFWFAAPDVSHTHTSGPDPGDGRPIYMCITAEQAANIKIEQPANPSFLPIEFTLLAGEQRRVPLCPPFFPDVFENYQMAWPLAPGQTVQKKGIRITSNPGNITAYYELNNTSNRAIFALKGQNALGKEFYVSTQNFFPNGIYANTAKSGFVIVATEDGTTVHVHRNRTWHYFFSDAPDTIVLTLNRGETFAFISDSIDADAHINGVYVTSDKDIAITWYDDSVRKRNASGFSYDICGDQLIPVNMTGRNYLVMKGDIFSGDDGGERIFLTATAANTDVFIDGVYRTTISAGEMYSEQIINQITSVHCSQPVYVNHFSGTGGGGELGGATLPTVEGCTGSYSVSSSRSTVAADNLLLNLMVRTNAHPTDPRCNEIISNFRVVTPFDTVMIPQFYFSFIPDSTWAYMRNEVEIRVFINSIITPGIPYTITNPLSRFHLGMHNGSASFGGKYAYFSDYSSNKGSAGIGGTAASGSQNFCGLQPVLLAAGGGREYHWFGVSDPADTILLNTTCSDQVTFVPDRFGTFRFGVTIYRDCYSDTTIYIETTFTDCCLDRGNMGIGDRQGPGQIDICGMQPVTFAADGGYKYKWFSSNNPGDTILLNSTTSKEVIFEPDTFGLYKFGVTIFRDCFADTTIFVQARFIEPPVADFELSTGNACSGEPVSLINKTANPVADKIMWQVGENPDDTISSPYIYQITNSTDSVIRKKVMLYTWAPLGKCLSSKTGYLNIYPDVKADFETEYSTYNVSDTVRFVNLSAGYGKESQWNFGDGGQSGEMDPQHVYTLLKDTVYLPQLIVSDSIGCFDTIAKSLAITYHLESSFAMSDNAGCNGMSIEFRNQSIGATSFLWDFGNGDTNTSNSVVLSKTFINNTEMDAIYKITLIASDSDGNKDSTSKFITVFPAVHADFFIDKTDAFIGEAIHFSNSSHDNLFYSWNFGDGTQSSEANPVHTYSPEKDTVFTARLAVTNGYTCSDTVSKFITVINKLESSFTCSDTTGCSSFTAIQFSDESIGASSVLWDFGDGESSILLNPSKAFSCAEGKDTVFTVKLIATDLAEKKDTSSQNIYIYNSVRASFNFTPDSAVSPANVSFSSTLSGSDFYTWLVDDILVSNEENFLKTFVNSSQQTATYKVRLIVFNDICSDTAENDVTVLASLSSVYESDLTGASVEVYPNPAEKEISLKINIEDQEEVQIDLITWDGKLIQSIFNSVLSSGNHTLKSDLGYLTDGVYFIRIEIGNTIQHLKIIKV